eukprot:759951-Prorocentrum_minimum.AAC.4
MCPKVSTIVQKYSHIQSNSAVQIVRMEKLEAQLHPTALDDSELHPTALADWEHPSDGLAQSTKTVAELKDLRVSAKTVAELKEQKDLRSKEAERQQKALQEAADRTTEARIALERKEAELNS